ncbi:MAG: transposase [Thermoanaerobaculia bacterium]
MARPPRLEHPGALWHVSARGAGRGEVFVDDADRTAFLALLVRTASIYGWRLHAWALAARSYELLVETPEPTLSRGMRDLNGVTTQRFNRRRGRSGPLFAGRFRAVLVEREAHLLALVRHVLHAAVREGLRTRAAEWPWSSFRATAGLDEAPRWLATDATLEALGGRPAEARRRFAAFVEEAATAAADPWSRRRGQVFLGSEAFAREAGRKAEHRPGKRTAGGPTPGSVSSAFEAALGVTRREMSESPRKKIEERALLAWALRARARAPLARIAATLGVGDAQASVLVRRGAALAEGDPMLAAIVEAL